MTRLLRVVCAMLGLAVMAGSAADGQPAAGYQPGQAVSGTVRVWSNDAMKGVLRRWQDGFHRHQPGVRIVATPIGSDVAMAGLYTNHADIALMGRDPTASEVQAFEWVYQVKPTRVQVMNGSLDAAEKSPALTVFVHRDNPLSTLTLAQLDAIFGSEHLRGLKEIRTWGQLGLGGDWAARPIDLFGPDATSGTGMFFRHVVLKDSRKLYWDRMQEFSDEKRPDGGVRSAGDRILDALAHDRFGIALAHLGSARPEVKALALARDERGPFVPPTRQSVESGEYPLGRAAFALFRRLPGKPVDSAVTEFLHYILSDEGQTDVVREGGYLPLSTDAIREQLVTLE